MIEIKVDKIRSYQTLVYKNGSRTFPKKEYKEYEKLISLQLGILKPIESDKDIKVYLHFKCKNRTVGDLDNVTKPILDTLQRCGKINNDRKICELVLKKSFGHKENSIEIGMEEL